VNGDGFADVIVGAPLGTVGVGASEEFQRLLRRAPSLRRVVWAFEAAVLGAFFALDPNPFVDRLIRRRRSELGCDLISRDGGIRALLRTLAAGRSVGLVVDTRQDDGEAIPFFGVDAPTSTVPARLALRHGGALPRDLR
jgi:KDO2-lipid IV(A) lauroyltransferase